MKIPETGHHLPREFQLRALVTDYSLSARNLSFTVSARQLVAGQATNNGRHLLTGWRWSASQRFTFHISNPTDEKTARATVNAAIRQLGQTLEALSAAPQELRDFILNIPLGFRAGAIKATKTPPRLKGAILSDAISAQLKALRLRIDEVEAALSSPLL